MSKLVKVKFIKAVPFRNSAYAPGDVAEFDERAAKLLIAGRVARPVTQGTKVTEPRTRVQSVPSAVPKKLEAAKSSESKPVAMIQKPGGTQAPAPQQPHSDPKTQPQSAPKPAQPVPHSLHPAPAAVTPASGASEPAASAQPPKTP